MNVRLRRLSADRQRLMESLANNPHIDLIGSEGEPPERYQFEIRVRGMVPGEGDALLFSATHKIEVFLPSDYPRRAPICRMLSPVFHPNIDPQKVCIGDHWSAGQSLMQLVVRIAEMICFQSYNTKSPLNAKAAAWAEENEAKLPLQRVDVAAGL